MKYASPFITIAGPFDRILDIDVREINLISGHSNTRTKIYFKGDNTPVESIDSSDKIREVVNERLKAIEECKVNNDQATFMALIVMIKEAQATKSEDPSI